LSILTLALFFQILLTAEFAENAEKTKSPSQLHQREFLHIKNLCALGVLGGKTTELALFFQILLTAEFAENAEETKSPSQLHQREFLHIKNLCALGVLGGKTTKLALNWLCFFAAQNRKKHHNPFSYRYIRSFQPLVNWVCFFKLATN